jgi:hypothetical protein
MAFNSARECAALEEKVRVSRFHRRCTKSKIIERFCGLTFDVFGKTKGIAAFRDSNGSDLASPAIHILKQVMMDGFKVLEIELSLGQRFLCSRG